MDYCLEIWVQAGCASDVRGCIHPPCAVLDILATAWLSALSKRTECQDRRLTGPNTRCVELQITEAIKIMADMVLH